MDKQVERIRDAVLKIPGSETLENDSELREALEEIDASLQSLQAHPHSDRIHCALTEAADNLHQKVSDDDSPLAEEENLASRVLHRLTEELEHQEEEHPGATLLLGRLANALAVFGL